jgi:hypothetical protein
MRFSYNPTHTLVAHRLPFEAIHIFLILRWRIRRCMLDVMATAKKLHAEGNLHPARLFRLPEAGGVKVFEMKDSAQFRDLWQ